MSRTRTVKRLVTAIRVGDVVRDPVDGLHFGSVTNVERDRGIVNLHIDFGSIVTKFCVDAEEELDAEVLA